MARPVCITYDSTCDLTPALLERFQIRVIPLTIIEGEQTFLDDGSYTSEHLYETFRRSGTLPKTAAVSPQEFLDFFLPILAEGMDIVHIDIISDLSSTYQNACLAASELEEGRIHVVDSRHLSTAAGCSRCRARSCVMPARMRSRLPRRCERWRSAWTRASCSTRSSTCGRAGAARA